LALRAFALDYLAPYGAVIDGVRTANCPGNSSYGEFFGDTSVAGDVARISSVTTPASLLCFGAGDHAVGPEETARPGYVITLPV